jgi:hypothetical protein
MFTKRKEIEVRDQPPESVEPEVVERRVYVEEKRRPRFLLGLVLGALLVAGAIAMFAHNEGSYQTAGANVDQSLNVAAENAKSATNDVAREVEARTDNTASR